MPPLLEYPAWIRPEIVPGLPFRWYGLMYGVAFFVTLTLVKGQVRREGLAGGEAQAEGLFGWVLVGLLVGGRLAATLVYADDRRTFWTQPWRIFWPFDPAGKFTGFAGMSYHGGLAGAFVGAVLWSRRTGQDLWTWGDRLAAAFPLGYTFGRLGNFLNGELWGRPSDVPWAMVFPADPSGLARHPSQLYEAAGEGLLLWLVLWFLVRPRSPFPGFVFGAYLVGYGLIRFGIEFFREPDAWIGLLGWGLSLGQWLCLGMAAVGAVVLVGRARFSPDRRPRSGSGDPSPPGP